MRLLLTLALILVLSTAAFAQSQNPLLNTSPDTAPADPATTETPADTGPQELSFGYGLSLVVPGGGLVRRPGAEDWDYGPSVVAEWNHETAAIYRVLVMVDDFESPITDLEFDLLSGTYFNGFLEDQTETEHVSSFRDFTVDGRTWRCFTVDLAYDDGYRCTCYNLLAWKAQCLYTIVGYVESTDPSPDDIRRNPGWPVVRDFLDGMAITPSMPVTEQPVFRREIPGHGLSLYLPASGTFLSAETPEVEAMGAGPMDCAFYWAMPSAPAHEMIWFTIAKHVEFTPAEYGEFVDGLWLGFTGGDELTRAPVTTIDCGGQEWTWGETGYTNPDTPETNTLVYICRQPGVVHMVWANSNRGYVAAGREQVEQILATVEFSEYTLEHPEIDEIVIDDLGLRLELPGGGMLVLPDDPDWDFADQPEMAFQWVHFDSPVTECRFMAINIGVDLDPDQLAGLRRNLLDEIVAQKGASEARELPIEQIGDRDWHVMEYSFTGESSVYTEFLFMAHEDGEIYYFYVDCGRDDREQGLAIARDALATLEIDPEQVHKYGAGNLSW